MNLKCIFCTGRRSVLHLKLTRQDFILDAPHPEDNIAGLPESRSESNISLPILRQGKRMKIVMTRLSCGWHQLKYTEALSSFDADVNSTLNASPNGLH